MNETVRAIRYPFAIDAGLSELASEPDHAEHVRQMILQVLFTAPGERINRPDFGCGVKRMVFAPLSEASASLAQVTVMEALEKWLSPVITIERVQVEHADARLDITIVYSLRTTGQQRYLNVEVTG